MNIPTDSIRLMSYNILYDYGPDKEYSWISRKKYVFSLLCFHAPDIFCLQEPLQNQVDDIAEYFKDYNYVTAGCGDGISAGQHITIFYLTDKFDLLDYGKFGLSETPEKLGIIGWDAKNPRLALWVKLYQKSTMKIIYIMNTHLDHKGEIARQQSAFLINKKMFEIANNFPILVCGDFNANSDSQVYRMMINNGFTDCANIHDAINYNLSFTYHKFILNKNENKKREYADDPRVLKVIDHIFYKGAIKVLRHGILGDNLNDVYPSDHLPKLCDILLL